MALPVCFGPIVDCQPIEHTKIPAEVAVDPAPQGVYLIGHVFPRYTAGLFVEHAHKMWSSIFCGFGNIAPIPAGLPAGRLSLISTLSALLWNSGKEGEEAR